MYTGKMDKLRQVIEQAEGCELKPYPDGDDGDFSIGYGHNLTQLGISPAVAKILLDEDLVRCWSEVTTEYPFTTKLPRVVLESLVELNFNMGATRLRKFVKMWANLQSDPPNFEGAADELLDSLYARQLPGRAERIAKQIRTQEYE